MRSVTYRLADLCKIKAPIPLGFAGENLHTRVQFDCKRVFDEYPGAVPSMTVQPPKGETYPVVIVRDGDIVTWDVTDADLCYEGTGEIQLAFVDDEVVVKSYICTTRIDRSLVSGGEPPTPIKDWIAYANTVLAEIPGDIDDALQEAKDSGEFDGPAGPKGDKGDTGSTGADGVSPTVSVETITGGHQLTVTDAEGDHTFNVMDGADGADGQDGVSPQVTVTKEGGTATITITDATGTTTQTISDGETGPQGPKGDTGDPAPAASVTTAVDAYLAENFSNPSNPPLDRTLLSSSSAAPADLVGNLKNEINVLEPSATLDDVAKFLKVKTVSGGKVTAYEFGSGSGGGSSGDIYIGTTEPTSGDAVVWINPAGASWESEMIDEIVAEVLEALPTWSGGSY